jgi:hypothetical protein
LQQIERQRVDGAAVAAGHGFGHAKGVEDRFFGRLGRGQATLTTFGIILGLVGVAAARCSRCSS